MKRATIGRNVISAVMSAVLVVAFAPAFVAPTQAQAKYTSADKKGAINYIRTWVDKTDKITLNAAKKIVAYFDNELLDRLDDTGNPLDSDIVAMKTWSEDAIGKINKLQANLNAMSITDFSASQGMLQTNLTWKIVNPAKLTGFFYQYKRRIGKASYGKNNRFKIMKKNTKGYYHKKVKKLKKNRTYTFKIRFVKKIYGETLYSAWSSTATTKVFPKFKKGVRYKTKFRNVRVRKSSNNKPTSSTLRYLSKGKRLRFSAYKIWSGVVWGKTTVLVNGDYRPGWVSMNMVKRA